MVDLVWPTDPGLAPGKMSFYLRPHTSRATSPLTNASKVYGLSAPMWIGKLTFTGSWRGGRGSLGRGAWLDAWVAQMEGGANRVAFWDFRRPRAARGQLLAARGVPLTYVGASVGDTTTGVAGFAPGTLAFSVGDYLGGDQRPHIVTTPVYAGPDGVAQVVFLPALVAAIAAATPAVVERAPAWFRLTSDDAGANDSTTNGQASYQLDFVEDVWW